MSRKANPSISSISSSAAFLGLLNTDSELAKPSNVSVQRIKQYRYPFRLALSISRTFTTTFFPKLEEEPSKSSRAVGSWTRVERTQGSFFLTTAKPCVVYTCCEMDPNAPSFEAMIRLALRGSDWQQLKASTSVPVDSNESPQQDDELKTATQADEALPPRVMTAKQKKKMARFEKTLSRDAGAVIDIIEADAITPVLQNVTWDRDPELLCSYNWQASTDGTNTIFVPGTPTKWQEPPLPITLEPDQGIQYSDYNYARQPQDPYSPMFQALSVMNPSYRFNDVDVLADRNNLRVLLDFCQGKSNGPFRLNIFLLFNTLVIVRKESRWWSTCDGVSYGWSFEKHFTRPVEGMEDATSHYRAIRYPLGPLNVVVRFEADAYDDGLASDIRSNSETHAVGGSSTGKPTFSYRSPIRVMQKGQIIPCRQLVELKTQKINPEDSHKVACQDQLWFGRTSLLFTGPYQGNTGVIKRVKYEVATDRIKVWEERNQDSLRKLPALLMQLRDILKTQTRPYRAVLVREDKGGPLYVRTMQGFSHALGRDYFANHWTPSPSSVSSRGSAYRGSRAGRSRGNHQPRGHDTTQTYPCPPLNDPQNHGRTLTESHRGQGGRGRGQFYVPRGRGRGRGQSNS